MLRIGWHSIKWIQKRNKSAYAIQSEFVYEANTFKADPLNINTNYFLAEAVGRNNY